MADVKGDLAGLSHAGGDTSRRSPSAPPARGSPTTHRAACPAIFWDLFGEQGHPVRTTVREMGPLLLARLMNLNEVQEGVLTIVFTVADKEGLMLLDLDDLQAMLTIRRGTTPTRLTRDTAMSRRRASARSSARCSSSSARAATISSASRRSTSRISCSSIRSGRGDRQHPRRRQADAEPAALCRPSCCGCCPSCSSCFPRSAIRDKPKLAFFFDEAHLLFDDAPPALLEKVEQVVRLIRSKGVGVYFITQNPIDIPDKVRASSATGCSMRCAPSRRATRRRSRRRPRPSAPIPTIDAATAITELQVGEALVSLLMPTARRRRSSAR